MFLRNPIKLHHSLAFRLTLWYGVIFAVSSCVAFLFFYLLITAVLRQQIDQDLSKQAGVFSSLLAARGIHAVKSLAVAEAQAVIEDRE